MKVGINGFALGAQAGGIETYVRNLIRTLPIVDPDGDYTLFLRAPLPDDHMPGAERMRKVVITGRAGPLRVPFSASLALMREGIGVVHLQEAAPLVFPSRIVVTLHDIAYERHPQFFPPDVVRRARISIPPTLRRATAILTDTEFSRRDIERRYAVDPAKVIVAPCAADPLFHPIHDASCLAAVRERYDTGPHFILYAGNLEPHKNLKTLLAAYVRLRRAGRLRHRLVLVGRSQYRGNALFDTVRTSGCEEDVVLTGYVPDADLVALFNAADLFVFPSLFEGFGLPPLEAMACGTPVITSNASTLPEVVGNAALMVDPLDVDDLATAIAMVLDRPDLQASLRARGLERAAQFSWERTARIVASVYRRAGERTPPSSAL